jgi:hypothetical protein
MGGSIGVIGGDLLNFISKSAPLLGVVLGSPLASVGVSLLSQAFGGSASDTDALAKAILNDPGAGDKLAEIEYKHSEALAQIASQDYAKEVDDRVDARKNGAQYKDFMRHMAYLVTIGFFGAFVMLFFPVAFDGGQRELLSMLVGMLVSKWQTIMDFFYGSCHPNQSRRIENGRNNS